MRTNEGMRRGRAAAGSIGVAIGVAIATVGMALTAGSAAAAPGDDTKVVVCKYVGTPGGSLDHIIIVSESTLNNVENAQGDPYVPGQLPFSWTDAHGQSQEGSIALRYATAGEQAKDVLLSECPGYVPPTEDEDECENLPGDQPEGFECTKAPESGEVTSEGAPDCVTGTVPLFVQPWTQDYTYVNGAWVLGTQVFGDLTSNGTRDATEEECPTGPSTTPTVLPSEGVPSGNPGDPGTPGGDPGNGGTQPTVLPAESMPPVQVVPTAVDAGLASSPAEEPANGMLLVGLGVGLVLVGGAFGFVPVTGRGKRQV